MSAISLSTWMGLEQGTPTSAAGGGLWAAMARCRASRVTALVIGTALIGMADLYLTLTYLHGPGMSEGNPLARWIISMNSPWLLGAWKVMLVALTSTILLATRRTRSAEIAAWVCAGVMVWLAGQWTQYAEKAPLMTGVIGQLADHHDWVQFSTREAQ